MSFVVSARKYRPQKFEDVYGQGHITDTLKTAILSDKLAHAFLFTGPRGVGKTTCARILAKVINAPDPVSAVKDGSYADMQIDIALNIFELDAASNNSVDNIRNLVDQVRIPPQVGTYKVFIIDEVHMLSSAAFNAFLKTLEEPPPYAIFILATTEKHKIIPTILSRCQIFDFKRIQIKEMITQMQNIAKDEKIKVEEDALHLIAEKADGAMRDALSIFDRIVNSNDKDITRQDVVEQLNLLDYEYFFKTGNAILKEDEAETLLVFDEVLRNGFEGDHFINGLGEHLRNLLICKDEQTHKLLQVSDKLKERYINQANLFKSSDILSSLDLINKADLSYPRAKNQRLHIEIALLKLCYLGRIKKVLPSQNSEKKSPDLTTSTTNAANKTSSPERIVKPKIEVKAQSEAVVETSSAEVIPEKKAQTPSSSADQQKSSRAIDNTTMQNTPSIGNINSILNEISAASKVENDNLPELTIESIEELYNKYLKNVTSPSIANAMSKTVKTLEGNTLAIKVPNQLSKDIFLQETKLIQQIREEFKVPELELQLDIDKALFPEIKTEKPRKFLSDKEKYEVLSKTNPLLKEMIDRFDLKLDS